MDRPSAPSRADRSLVLSYDHHSGTMVQPKGICPTCRSDIIPHTVSANFNNGSTRLGCRLEYFSTTNRVLDDSVSWLPGLLLLAYDHCADALLCVLHGLHVTENDRFARDLSCAKTVAAAGLGSSTINTAVRSISVPLYPCTYVG